MDLYLADAPVPPKTAHDLAEAVKSMGEDVLCNLTISDQDLAPVQEGVKHLVQWADGLREPQSVKLPEYFADEDILGLITAGDHMPFASWHGIIERGAEVLPLLHPLLDDFSLADFDDEPVPGASRYQAAIDGAFIGAAIGDLSSVPHIIGLAALAEDSDWLHEGLVWFPSAFGPAAMESFLDFLRDQTVRWYQRAAVAKGVVWAAGQHPELRDQVVIALVETINNEWADSDLLSALVRPAAATGACRLLLLSDKNIS